MGRYFIYEQNMGQTALMQNKTIKLHLLIYIFYGFYWFLQLLGCIVPKIDTNTHTHLAIGQGKKFT